MRVLLLVLCAGLLAGPGMAADRSVRQVAGGMPFTAAIETMRLLDAQGAAEAEVVTTAFLGEGAGRPVAFAVNGGPGASSAWLNLGALGPWRVPLGAPSDDATPIENAETWLGFTDLVFIDPPGTGYSRPLGEARTRFYTVDSDIELLATVARRWLEAHGRLASPVFVVGESYGGFRAPRLARAMLQSQGVGVRGLVLVSPVLDFNGRNAPYDPVRWAALLPSLTAAARHAASRGELRDVEDYAASEYVTDLLRGPRDGAATDRITGHVAGFTGLDPALVRRRGGRIDFDVMLREREPGRVGSPYDATIASADPFPTSSRSYAPDVVLDGFRGPVTAAMLAIYGRLGWTPEGAPARQYELLNTRLAWDYGRSNNRPESMTALRQFLALDPNARVLVVHGLYDLVTPYFATALLLDQVPETSPPGRLEMRAYAGGHMFYTNERSRAALRAAVEAMFSAAGAEPGRKPPAATERPAP